MRREEIETKLSQLAQLAEDLSAELYTESPSVSERLSKVGAYARKIGTCVRLHGQVPEHTGAGGSPLVNAAKGIDQLVASFQNLGSLIPRERQ